MGGPRTVLRIGSSAKFKRVTLFPGTRRAARSIVHAPSPFLTAAVCLPQIHSALTCGTGVSPVSPRAGCACHANLLLTVEEVLCRVGHLDQLTNY